MVHNCNISWLPPSPLVSSGALVAERWASVEHGSIKMNWKKWKLIASSLPLVRESRITIPESRIHELYCRSSIGQWTLRSTKETYIRLLSGFYFCLVLSPRLIFCPPQSTTTSNVCFSWLLQLFVLDARSAIVVLTELAVMLVMTRQVGRWHLDLVTSGRNALIAVDVSSSLLVLLALLARSCAAKMSRTACPQPPLTLVLAPCCRCLSRVFHLSALLMFITQWLIQSMLVSMAGLEVFRPTWIPTTIQSQVIKLTRMM